MAAPATSMTKALEPEPIPVEEQIRKRAHELWFQRGGGSGSAEGDWLQAEEEIKAAQAR